MKYFFFYFFLGSFVTLLAFRLTEKKEKRSNPQDDFSYAVIHELRAYLTNLNWVFEKLVDKGLGTFTEDQYKTINLGKTTTENANSLVNDTLNAISVDRTEARFKFKLNDINKVIADIISEYALIAKERDISLTFWASEKPIPLFFFDHSQMYVAIHDIVHNSMKYTHNGGNIAISTNLIDDKVKIDVVDNGIGIPEKDQKNIFKKFFRAQNAKVLHEEGSGLGMFITKSIISRHKGDITLQSEENKGTKVEIILPLSKTEPQENKN
ncbi:MAG: HAMP domain-containing sensor histidine kinase [bacterium]